METSLIENKLPVSERKEGVLHEETSLTDDYDSDVVSAKLTKISKISKLFFKTTPNEQIHSRNQNSLSSSVSSFSNIKIVPRKPCRPSKYETITNQQIQEGKSLLTPMIGILKAGEKVTLNEQYKLRVRKSEEIETGDIRRLQKKRMSI